MMTACLFWGLTVSLFAETGKGHFVPASDSCIVYMGRVSRTFPDVARFTYPGVSICADFEGTSLKMKTNPASGAYMVEIDNFHPYRIQIGKMIPLLRWQKDCLPVFIGLNSCM